MLSIEMLPAERGDAILLQYGPGDEPVNRVLIDGGPANSGLYRGVRQRLEQVPVDEGGRRHFELLVISHVDSDHIEGVIQLLLDEELGCAFDDIWFNDWRHIQPLNPGATASRLGPAQGEFVGALLAKQARPWNRSFDGGPVVVPDEGPLPVWSLPGGLELTLLSPKVDHLKRLAATWDTELAKLGFEPGDAATALAQLEHAWWAQRTVTLGDDDPIAASDDRSVANGSSIAVLARFGGRSVLLAADAYDDVLTESLRRLRGVGATVDPPPVALDAIKLSHHGSEKNTTPQLLQQVRADAYLVSSNGDRFKHPNAVTLDTVVKHHGGAHKPILCFNYRQPQTERWGRDERVDARYEEAAHLVLATDPVAP